MKRVDEVPINGAIGKSYMVLFIADDWHSVLTYTLSRWEPEYDVYRGYLNIRQLELKDWDLVNHSYPVESVIPKQFLDNNNNAFDNIIYELDEDEVINNILIDVI